MAGTAISYALRLRPGVARVTDADGASVLRIMLDTRSLRLGRLRPGEHAVLRRLTGPAATRHQLTVTAPDMPPDQLDRLLTRLWTRGWLERTASADDHSLYTVIPLGEDPMPLAGWPTPVRLALSRFAVLHRVNGDLRLESPLAHSALLLHDPAAVAAVASLTPTQQPAQCPLPREVWTRLRDELFHAKLAVPMVDGRPVEDDNPDLTQWSVPELWFHWRSRTGPHTVFSGRVGRLRDPRGKSEPLPERRPPHTGPPTPLYRSPAGTAATLTDMLDNRRSIREHDDDQPLTLTQLGEFLFRSARAVRRTEPTGRQVWRRPYPSGGGAFELEIYPVVRHVHGLNPGIYHYDPFDHALRLVPSSPHAANTVLRFAQLSSIRDTPPQLALVFTSRFGRMLNHYEAIGYAATMKNVGVLQQTMYLVGTAMGIATCALGSGLSHAFTRAIHLDPRTESPVGEFMLGSKPHHNNDEPSQ
jgi:SagB-type dehydrogenase family enzyme